jgi:hypothetical protein
MPAEVWTLPLSWTTPFPGVAGSPFQGSDALQALRAAYRLLVGPEVAAGLVEAHARLRESRMFGGGGDGGRVILSVHDDAKGPVLKITAPRGLADDEAALLGHTVAIWITLGCADMRSRDGSGSLAFRDAPTFADVAGRPLPHRELAVPVLATGDSLRRVMTGAAAIQRLLDSAAALRGRVGLALPADTVEHHRDVGPAYHLRLSANDPQRTRVVLWTGGWQSPAAALAALDSEIDRATAADAALWHQLDQRLLVSRAPMEASLRSLPITRGRVALHPVRLGAKQGEIEVRNSCPSPLMARVVAVGFNYGLVITLLSGCWPGRDLPVVGLDGNARMFRGHIPLRDNTDDVAGFVTGLPGATVVCG